MRIVRHYEHCPPLAQHSVIALGNFDGVHRGHQAVIAKTKKIALQENLPCAVMTFEPHPLSILRPEQELFRITPLRLKVCKLQEAGIDILFAIPFTSAFSQLTAEAFVKKLLVEKLAVRHVVIGHDFIFGHKRSGNASLLRDMAAHYGFGLTQVEAEAEKGTVFSSSRIRNALQTGDVTTAAHMLGYSYTIKGRVQKGDARGRLLGFPTANIKLHGTQQPMRGVYAIRATVDGSVQVLHGVANLGTKPTFAGERDLLEVHLFDFNADIYGKYLCVEFIDFIRREQKFSSIDALVAQIKEDVEIAKRTLHLK